MNKTFPVGLLMLGLFPLLTALVLAQDTMHLAPGLPVAKPIPKYAEHRPKPEDFNALLREFLGTDYIDIKNEKIDPKLTALFSKETSNACYNRLKIKERGYQGAILVDAAVFSTVGVPGRQQIVSISARIAYKSFLSKTIETHDIQIVFSGAGIFKEVRYGLGTIQDL